MSLVLALTLPAPLSVDEQVRKDGDHDGAPDSRAPRLMRIKTSFCELFYFARNIGDTS